MNEPGAGRRISGEHSSALAALRRRAEAKVAEIVRLHPEDVGSIDLQRLVHELNVHQAELEMQNEELSRTQQALEASRGRYYELYDHAPVGYVTFGMDGLITEANRLAASMLGLPAGRLPGRRLADFVAPEQRPTFLERYSKLLARAPPAPCELQLVRLDHNRFWVQLQMAMVFDAPPSGPRCRAVFVDITERMRLQSGLARLAAIVASSHDAIIGQDLDGQVTSWNRGAERLFGYAADEMIGRTLQALLPPPSEGEPPAIRHLRRGETVAPFETTLTSKAGAPVPVSLSLFPVADQTGRISGTSLIARDIAERIEAQQALHVRLRQLDLLSQTGRILIMTDVAGPELFTGLFRKVSEAIGADKYWSYRPGGAGTLELVGSSGLSDSERARIATIRLGETLCGMVAERRAVLVLEELASKEQPQAAALAALGARCYAGFPLLAGDSLVGVVGFAMRASDHFHEGDLPVIHTVCAQVAATFDRLRLVQELRSNEEALRDADRRKDDFIAMLAHELRNPLAPINNALAILERVNGSDPAQKDVIGMMERQVNSIVRLVDDLLEVSRMTRGKLTLHRQRLNLANVLDGAIETSRPLIEAGSHRLSVAVPDEPLVVEGDPVRLAQVIGNLLNNAAKYTDSGGEIWLSARRDGDRVEVSVQDTGRGIAPEMLPRIFEMFAQGGSREKAAGGLGIGLTLVRTLVEMHGGTVEASSPGAGAGSTFRVRLPLAEGAPDLAAPHAAVPRLTARCRALLVDDNKDVVDTLASVLRMLGAEVEVAYDGPSALDALSRFHPTAVVLDIGMPGMDGYEVARRIREQPGGRDLMLIALTGWGQAEDRLRTQQAGVDHHLVKPADLEHLQRLLAAAGV